MAMVYAEWASHGDNGPYHGWVVAWNVTNLSTQGMVLAGVLCTDPNGGEGGIWGGGGGLTFDPDETFNGQPAFYFETGNGDPRGGPPPLNANGFPADDDYYESLVKVEADPTTTADQPEFQWLGPARSSITSRPTTSTRSTTPTRISAPARPWCCPTRPASPAIRT